MAPRKVEDKLQLRTQQVEDNYSLQYDLKQLKINGHVPPNNLRLFTIKWYVRNLKINGHIGPKKLKRIV